MDNPVLGTWQLQSWKIVTKTNEEKFPFGVDANGILIYSSTGHMSVHLGKNDRESFQTQTIFEVTAEEALQSFHSYASYCGRYEIQDDKILHFVTMHSNPNWIGSVQERQYRLGTDRLYLSHPLEEAWSYLEWLKVS